MRKRIVCCAIMLGMSLAISACGGSGGASNAGGGSGSGGSGGSTPSAITLSASSPQGVTTGGVNYIAAGVADFTLKVTGGGFINTSVVQWNGSSLATTYVDASDVTASVAASLVATSGSTATISVKDTANGNLSTNSLTFHVASPAAATAGVVQLISVGYDGAPANDDSLAPPSISATGRYVVFQSVGANIVSGAASGKAEIYERDTCIGAPAGCSPSTIRISQTYDGSQVNGQSYNTAVSGDGRYVVFDTNATNILANTNLCASNACLYLRDTCIGASPACVPSTTMLSVDARGNYLHGGSPRMSASARYVVFDAIASDYLSGGNAQVNVILRDTCIGASPACTPTNTLLGLAFGGGPATLGARYPALSADGRYVAFDSYSKDLIHNDANTYPDIFVRDTCIGAAACAPNTAIASLAYDGAFGNGDLDYNVWPSLSADGRFIAFASTSTNLVATNVNGKTNVYLRDACAGASSCTPSIALLSVGNAGEVGDGGSHNQSMSADGRYIAFASIATNFTPDDTFAALSWKDVFVRDTCAGAPAGCTPSTVRASVSRVNGSAANSNAINDDPVISADGHYVVFLSASTNYLSGGGNGHTQVYIAKTGF